MQHPQCSMADLVDFMVHRFTLDESVLYKGAALHTAWALAYLGAHAQGAQGASGNHKHEL